MTALQNTAMQPDPALIVVLPVTRNGHAYSVAVGTTDESYERWRAFLNLANVPPRSVNGGRIMSGSLLKTIAVLLAIPIGFVGFMLLGRLVSDLLSLAVPDEGLCNVTGTLVFVLGIVTAILYGAILTAQPGARPIANQSSGQDHTTHRYKTFALFVLVVTVKIVVPTAFYVETSAGKVVGIVLAYTWALVVGWDYSRRLADFKSGHT